MQEETEKDLAQKTPDKVGDDTPNNTTVSKKPAWVEKYGNVSQIISACAATVFGIIAAIISLQVASIQRENVLTAEIARDRDAVHKYRLKKSADYVKWRRSLECARAIFATTEDATLFGVENYILDSEDQKKKVFARTAIENCGEKNSKDAEKKAKYYLATVEDGLFAWSAKLPLRRKEIYDYEFGELCFAPFMIRKTNSMFWIRHYSRVYSFIVDCDDYVSRRNADSDD